MPCRFYGFKWTLQGLMTSWKILLPNRPPGHWPTRLTHWGRVTHICVSKLTIIGPDNGLSPGRHQAIIGTNAGISLIWPLGTNFSEILIGIQTFSFKKMYLKMSSAKWRPFCLGLNVLIYCGVFKTYGSLWQWWTLLQVMARHQTSDRLLCTSVLTSCSLSNKEYDSITSYL